MSAAREELDALRAALAADAAAVAMSLLGQPNPVHSGRGELRWGSKGSFVVTITGQWRGRWKCFETSEHGDVLALIQRTRGGGFPSAIAWARRWTGLGAEPARFSRPRPPRPSRSKAAGAAAERTRKIEEARRIAAGGVPLEGTLGEVYLASRGIKKPASGWPEWILWHPKHRAMLAVATDQAGAVRAVQRIHLGEDGSKVGMEEMAHRRLKAVKMTNGVLDGAAVRLPGKLPALLAEGPETGLAAWVATKHAVLIALGSVGALKPPGYAVVLADDDARNSPAELARRKIVARWRTRGIEAVVCHPWAKRCFDRSDIADVLKEAGAIAVRQRVREAIDGGFRDTAQVEVPVAQRRIETRMREFVNLALAVPGDPIVHAIRATTGARKSVITRRMAVDAIRRLRKREDDHPIVIVVPRHDLGAEYASELQKIAPDVVIERWHGRDADDPARPGKKMCADLDMVNDVRAMHLDVDTYACGPCTHAAKCSHLSQRRAKADIWIIPATMISQVPPAAISGLAMLFIDDAGIEDFLLGADLRGPITLALDVLDAPVPDRLSLLGEMRARVFAVLRREKNGPVLRAALLAAGLTVEMMRAARRLEWQTKVEPRITTDMTRDQRRAALRDAAANKDLCRRMMLWTALEALLADDGPEASGWAALQWKDGDDGRIRVIRLRGRRELAQGWRVPTMIAHATLETEQLAHVWPRLKLVADIVVAAPYQRVWQAERSYALSMLDPGVPEGEAMPRGKKPLAPKEAITRRKRLRNVHAFIARIARQSAPGRVLVVAQKAVRTALEAIGGLPPNVTWAHHNAVAGLNTWRDVRAEIVIGRTQPPPEAVEAMAEALTGVAVAPLRGWYERHDAKRLDQNGRLTLAEADRHPNPIAESFRRSACGGGLLQIIGRPRGIDRTAADPVDIYVLTDIVLDLPIDGILTKADLDPSPDDKMLATGGIAYDSPMAASLAYPDLWTNRINAAAEWGRYRAKCGTFSYKESPIGKSTALRRFRFRFAGQGNDWCEGSFDPTIVAPSDLQRQVEAQQRGALSVFEVLEPLPPAEAPAIAPAVASMVQKPAPIAWDEPDDGQMPAVPPDRPPQQISWVAEAWP